MQRQLRRMRHHTRRGEEKLTAMEQNNEWLCRNCNTLVADDVDKCPRCGAERPEAIAPSSDTEEFVVVEEPQTQERKKAKYIFRESVLVNAADILLILGIFATVATLLSPIFFADTIQNIKLISIVGGIATFCLTLVVWALLRSVGEISRMLREKE